VFRPAPVYEQAELKRQLFGARSDPLTPEEEGQLVEVAADLKELADVDPPGSATALADEAEQKPAPMWAELQQQALALQPHWLPQSSLAKAVNYLRNEYAALIGYLQSPAYAVDNNLVENSIRGPAVGRRRWLFIGHPHAGWPSAVSYSFIVSCRRRGINP
jgi:hypothetical protein